MKHLPVFLLLLVALLSACTPSTQTVPVPPTFNFEMPTLPPEPTHLPTWTLWPSQTPWPSRTPVPSATITPTPLPLPDSELILHRYQGELKPLAKRLLAAGIAPGSFSVPADHQVILLPLDEKLFYAQELLFPAWSMGSTDSPAILYVLYEYQRGDDLGYASGPGFNVSRETQEVLVNQILVAVVDGKRYRIEEKKGLGGSGSQGMIEMLGNAVQPLENLPGEADVVKTTIETVIGFACGIDWQEQIDSSRKVALFLQALSSPYWSDRASAISNLGRFKLASAEIIPSLITALQDKDSSVSHQAIQTLGSFGPAASEAVPFIIQTLKEDDPYPQYHQSLVADALARIGPESVPALLQALDDPTSAVRAGAAEALAKMSDQAGVLPALIQLLSDPDDAVIRAASDALLALPSEQVIPLLIPLLSDQNHDLSFNTSQVLAKIGKSAVPALLEALKDTDPLVRQSAASCLGQIRDDERVIPALLQALNDPEWIVRDSAALSLGDLDAVEAVPALIQALSDPEEGVRSSAAWGLESIGTPAREAVPALILVLGDSDDFVRQAAVQALKTITGQDFGLHAADWQTWWEAQTP